MSQNVRNWQKSTIDTPPTLTTRTVYRIRPEFQFLSSGERFLQYDFKNDNKLVKQLSSSL